MSEHGYYRDAIYRANRAVVIANVIPGHTKCDLCGQTIEHGQRVDCHHGDTVAERAARGLAPDHSLDNLAATHARCNRGGRPPRRRPVDRADIYTEPRR